MNLFDWFRIIACGLSLAAIVELPVGYYIFLRISVTLVAAYSIYKSVTNNDKIFTILFSGLTVLFNPLIPISFERETWAILNIVSSVILIVSLLFVGDSVVRIRLLLLRLFRGIINTVWLLKKRVAIIAFFMVILVAAGFYYLIWNNLKWDLAEEERKLIAEFAPPSDSSQSNQMLADLDNKDTEDNSFSKEVITYHNSDGNLIGLGNLSTENASTCLPYSDTGRIMKIAYDEKLSLRIIGFSLLTKSGERRYLNLDESIYENRLCMADLYSLSNLITEDADIVYTAFACGAAARVHVINSFTCMHTLLME